MYVVCVFRVCNLYVCCEDVYRMYVSCVNVWDCERCEWLKRNKIENDVVYINYQYAHFSFRYAHFSFRYAHSLSALTLRLYQLFCVWCWDNREDLRQIYRFLSRLRVCSDTFELNNDLHRHQWIIHFNQASRRWYENLLETTHLIKTLSLHLSRTITWITEMID